MSKLAAFQFYPGDWLKDPALSVCSPGARGVWIDLLCLMFESPMRGYLVTNGRPWTLEETAEALRGHPSANLLFLKELLRNGVMKVDKKHRFFSARLARDEHQREVWRGEKRRQLIQNKESHSGTHSAKVLPDLHSSSSSSNQEKPYPTLPASREGNGLVEYSLSIYGSTVVIKKPPNRRLWTEREKEGMQGKRAEDYVSFFQSKGFQAWIETPKQ